MRQVGDPELEGKPRQHVFKKEMVKGDGGREGESRSGGGVLQGRTAPRLRLAVNICMLANEEIQTTPRPFLLCISTLGSPEWGNAECLLLLRVYIVMARWMVGWFTERGNRTCLSFRQSTFRGEARIGWLLTTFVCK